MKYIFFIFIFIIITGCSLSRKVKKEETKTDSTHVTNVDSSWLKKVLEQNQYSKQGLKETFIYGRDSLIYLPGEKVIQQPNNYYSTQPTVYIRETMAEQGSSSRQDSDSGHLAKLDSSMYSLAQKWKDSNTKVGIDWKFVTMVVLLGIIALIGLFTIKKLMK